MRPTVRIALAAFCIAPLCLHHPGEAAAETATAPSVHDAAARTRWRATAPDGADPAPISAELEAALKTIHTEPGALPRLKLRHEGRLYDLPLEHTAVEIEAAGPVARVEVRQRYRNPFQEPIETVYVFPLPENSAVTDLRFAIGDRIVRSELKRRAEARRTYEKAKASGHTAALLEQERPNGFTQSVANIPPKTDVEVVIRYVQDLTYDANTYEVVFPMVLGPRFTPGTPIGGPAGRGGAVDTDQVPDASRLSPPVVGRGMRTGHDIDVKVTVDAGGPVVDWSVPTHRTTGDITDGRLAVQLAADDRVPNRDFVLRYRVGGDAPQASLLTHRPEGEDGGYFSLMVHPPTLDLDKVVGQREMIFVLDVSGSMNGLPIAMSKRAIELALRRLRPADTFNVMSFAGKTSTLYDRARPVNRRTVEEALKWVDRLMAGGGTQMGDAIDAALAPDVESGRDRHVFFLTDGYVSNEAAIMQRTRRYIEAKMAAGQNGRVFGFGVGSSPNRCLLGGLSAQGRGVTFYASSREDPAHAVDRFFALVDQPVLTDVQIDWGGLPVADVTPAVLPDLFASRPLMVHGRFAGVESGTVTLRARMAGRPIELPLQVDLSATDARNDALAALWARSRIDGLGTKLWGPGQAPKNVVDAIVDLSISHRVMTAYTSFVAVDRSRTVQGPAHRIDVAVEAPEGVDPVAAGARPLGRHGTVGDGDGDGDGDGLADDHDKCPDHPEDPDGFDDEDGCPEYDNDGDRILDSQDQCPNQPEDYDGDTDADGCPDVYKQILLHSERIEILEKIYFRPGTARIRRVSHALLDQVAWALIQNPQIPRVEVQGHTDAHGSDASNQRLSQRRAEAVMRYLVGKGVAAGRLTAQGYGEMMPIDTNKTRAGRANNRRVEFKIIPLRPGEERVHQPRVPPARPAPAPRPKPRRAPAYHAPAGSPPVYSAPTPRRVPVPRTVTCKGTWISSAPASSSARVEAVDADGHEPLWLAATLADAQACYELALLSTPDLKGEMTLEYDDDAVEHDGGVKHAQMVRCISESHALRGTGTEAELTLRLIR